MVYKTTLRKKILSFLLLLSIIIPTLYSPFALPVQRAEAFGPGDFAEIKQLVKRIVDGVAMHIAQRMVDEIVRSSVNWAQNGFDGEPAFVADLPGTIANIANAEAGSYINRLSGTNLCAPFRPQIMLSLREYYNTTYKGLNDYPQCTFTGITGNLQDFYQDFDNGGWQGWYSLTQDPANNPYDVYLTARSGLDNRIGAAIDTQLKKLDWGDGFKSKGECKAYNEYKTVSGQPVLDPNTGLYVIPIENGELINPEVGPGECIEHGDDNTPGTLIKDQLGKVLPTGLNKLISANHIEQLISAFASGLLNRFVFNSRGFASKNNSYTNETKDTDSDGIPDGYDYDADGNLDLCLHGKLDTTLSASDSNCRKSGEVQSSPYFVPICKSLADTIKGLEKYLRFLQDNRFSKTYSHTWIRQTMDVSGAVSNLEGIVSQYGLQDWDPMLNTIGGYGKFLDNAITSLVKDADITGEGLPTGDDDFNRRSLFIPLTYRLWQYLLNIQTKVVNQCDNPNPKDVLSVPVPPPYEEADPNNPGNQSSWINQYILDNNFNASCTIANGIPTLTTSPLLSLLPNLDTVPTVSYLTSGGVTYADITFTKGGVSALYPIACVDPTTPQP